MSGGGGESRGRRRHEEHEEHEEHVNHEAWVIPYADVLTLLMALFLVMWALGDTDEEKAELAAESFRRELNGGGASFSLGFGDGGDGPLNDGGLNVLGDSGLAPASADEDDEDDEDDDIATPAIDTDPDDGIMIGAPGGSAVAGEEAIDPMEGGQPGGLPPVLGEDPFEDIEERDPLNEIEQAVREEAVGSGLSTAVGFRREERGLIVSIVSDSVLFGPGDATVQADGRVILDVIANALENTPNPIIVEGHTDSRPISTARFPSNWELSTARATSVVRLLTDFGLSSGRLSAAGYSDTRPVDESGTPEAFARNRRVEIVVIG